MVDRAAENFALKSWQRRPQSKDKAIDIYQCLIEIPWREGLLDPELFDKAAAPDLDPLVVLEIADLSRSSGLSRDVYASLVWVAASLGCAEAQFRMAHLLAHEATSAEPARAPAYLHDVAIQWLTKQGIGVDFVPEKATRAASRNTDPADLDTDVEADANAKPLSNTRSRGVENADWEQLEDIDKELEKFIAEELSGSSQAQEKPPVAPSPPQPPAGRKNRVVVCEKIGDPSSSEGTQIGNRYRSIIGKRLGFRGNMARPGETAQEMAETYPWAANVARYIGGQLQLLYSSGNTTFKLPPLLLVGPPGSGKTHMLEWLCQKLDAAHQTIACGGMTDSAGLSAVTRGWSTSRPSAPVEAMAAHKCANPVLLLDELDKGSALDARNGSVMATLISMIQSRNAYYDACLMADVDISHVSFLATANTLDTLPPALKDRFVIFHVPRPGQEHFAQLLKGVRAHEAKRLNVHEEFLPYLEPYDMVRLRDTFVSSGCSIRVLEQAYRLIIGERAAEEMEMALRPN